MISYPPKIDLSQSFEEYTDGLCESIPFKIEEILLEMEKIEEYYLLLKKSISFLNLRGEIDPVGIYFWFLWAELIFSDYYIYQKWLIYWLNLFEKVSDYETEEPFLKKNRFDSWEMYSIKLKPIEDYYPGEIKGMNNRLYGLCPFHEERTASFFIFRNSNTYHCFGCGLGGDVIDFIVNLKNLSFKEAVEYLS